LFNGSFLTKPEMKFYPQILLISQKKEKEEISVLVFGTDLIKILPS